MRNKKEYYGDGDSGIISIASIPKHSKIKRKCKWKDCDTMLNGYRVAEGFKHCTIHKPLADIIETEEKIKRKSDRNRKNSNMRYKPKKKKRR